MAFHGALGLGLIVKCMDLWARMTLVLTSPDEAPIVFLISWTAPTYGFSAGFTDRSHGEDYSGPLI